MDHRRRVWLEVGGGRCLVRRRCPCRGGVLVLGVVTFEMREVVHVSWTVREIISKGVIVKVWNDSKLNP